jgi:hypothetical protein
LAKSALRKERGGGFLFFVVQFCFFLFFLFVVLMVWCIFGFWRGGLYGNTVCRK